MDGVLHLIDVAKALIAAQRASDRTGAIRRDLPLGASRARVTTANAKWARAAEERDRREDAYRAAIEAEAVRLGLLPAPTLAVETNGGPEVTAALARHINGGSGR